MLGKDSSLRSLTSCLPLLSFHSADATQGVCLVDMGFIYWYCRRQNSKKAAVRAQPGYVKLENQEWLDLTDRENPEFTYTL